MGGKREASGVQIAAFTQRGLGLARVIARGLPGSATVSAPRRLAERADASEDVSPMESLDAWCARAFASSAALVFVGATGIAVRAIAPHLRGKYVDPAVVAVDERGRFAIPLVSGHVGGANDLARRIARLVGAQPVVTTATDGRGLFAVDEWAVGQGLVIVERELAKEVSATLLDGGTVGFASDVPVEGPPPVGLERIGECERAGASSRAEAGTRFREDPGASPCAEAEVLAHAASESPPRAGEHVSRETFDSDGRPALGILVSFDAQRSPFPRTLHLVPRWLTLGVGCRRGADVRAIEQLAADVLSQHRLSPLAVRAAASIDVKADEPALATFTRRHGWELTFRTAEELRSVPGSFSASDFVERTVGVDNVCERAASWPHGRVLVSKQARDGVTVAVGCPPRSVTFDRPRRKEEQA